MNTMRQPGLSPELFGELQFTNRFHQLPENFYSYQSPTPLDSPELVHINPEAASLLDLDIETLNHDQYMNEQFRDFISGNRVIQQSEPIAAIYAGHQFGHFVPQLGDGRALLLGEIFNKQQQYWEIQLKGSGITPYSRQGDGRAVLRSTIREYLCSEAMHALGIPTTRALAMVNSQEEVHREQLESGAVLLRMAPSFIRFGSFELFASRGQTEQLKQLADFTLQHYYPELLDSSNRYSALLQTVAARTARTIAHWQTVGFAHGVMNTDNMSILGLTIDYGPFGFLDSYDRDYICNHSDHQGRYSFKNQPAIAFWNLSCLANALLPLLSVDEAQQALDIYEPTFKSCYLELMQQKLGLFNSSKEALCKDNEKLVLSLMTLLHQNRVDYTIFFRQLSSYAIALQPTDENPPSNCGTQLRDMFMDKKGFDAWSRLYIQALEAGPIEATLRKIKMDRINPKYVLRNYMAQLAIDKATVDRDYSEVDNLFSLLSSPFNEHPEMEHYAGLPPDWAEKVSVSCSS